MIQTSIARRYARALFEVAGPDFARVGDQIATLAKSLEEDGDLARFFEDPTVARADRSKVLEDVIAKAGFETIVGNFLRLLEDRSRIAELPGIVAAYNDLVDVKVGRIRARVTSASPLPQEISDRLQSSLSEATNKQVEIATSVDQSLLGGVVAQVGNFVYDGSLRTQLERMHRSLTGRA